jgi:maltooligosyltrehalose trehalohydrolase
MGNEAVEPRIRRGLPRGRRRAQGAEVFDDGTDFRLWAPVCESVELRLEESQAISALTREADGHWFVRLPQVRAGAHYRYRVDGQEWLPDPAARFLPEGPHGPAEVVDSRAFAWTDTRWRGVHKHGQIIYEMHVGTFSPEGTWAGAMSKLALLKELGVTVVEVMPICEYPGEFGWGYDGVQWFAPSRTYGRPDDLRRFVDHAHRLGLGVILDVVYNHLGPDGNYLARFSPFYFSKETTEWGASLNFDGEQCEAMRRLAIDSAAAWIDEYHFDGLRLDAIHSIFDRSAHHIVAAIARECRWAAGPRALFISAENETQESHYVQPVESGGAGLDALWNDDFHHTAVVALSGRRHAYYRDFHGTAAEWLAPAKYGFLFQGQCSEWQALRRGHPTRGLAMASFVSYLENHDQVANSLQGARLWQQSQPGCHRAMTALLLLGPWTPLLFQGQEWNCSSPFHYFAQHTPELAGLVRSGRAEFMAQFPGASPELLPDPGARETFDRCRLRWEERDLPLHERALKLHRDLITLRRQDLTLWGAHARKDVRVEFSALNATCGWLRFFADDPHGDRLLLINLGPDVDWRCVTDPLLAPPARDTCWRVLWSSEDPGYGGHGTFEPEDEEHGWTIPGSAATLLAPRPCDGGKGSARLTRMDARRARESAP